MTTALVKMKANMADAPYLFEKGKATIWKFALSYGQMADFLPVVHQYLAASRMPPADRDAALQVLRSSSASEDQCNLRVKLKVKFIQVLHDKASGSSEATGYTESRSTFSLAAACSPRAPEVENSTDLAKQ